MIIEEMIYSTMMQLFGNPLNMGIFIFTIFMGFVILFRLGEGAMIVVMIAVFFLVASFIPELILVIGISVGIMFGLALIKITRG